MFLYFSFPFELISKSEFSIDNCWKEIGSEKGKGNGADLVFYFILLDFKIDCEVNVWLTLDILSSWSDNFFICKNEFSWFEDLLKW
jgi:hypothetical protein